MEERSVREYNYSSFHTPVEFNNTYVTYFFIHEKMTKMF